MTDYNAVPGLVHVELKLSNSHRKHLRGDVEVRALHDSGCAKSIIKTSVFNKLLAHGDIEIEKPKVPVALVSCTGEYQDISGTADIILHFQGTNGISMSFPLNVIVHPELSQDFLLGRDFTGSDAKAFETNDYLFLTHQYDIYVENLREAVKSGKICQVQLCGGSSRPMHVETNREEIIPPFSIAHVVCTLSKSQNHLLPIHSKGKGTYEILKVTQPRLKSLPILMEYSAPNRVVIPVYNCTHEEYTIPQRASLAEIKIWENTLDSYSLEMTQENFTEMQCNEARPEFIESDQGMTEEEKEEAFIGFLKRGYHHPSMTKEVEDKAALTELTLKNTVPISDEKFDDQFDLKHLHPQQKQFALQVFRKHLPAFSRHACDLGESKDIQMDILLKPEAGNKEHQIQKYIPIPHAVRGQVREILDQMLEFGIIRECDEPSLFCSNLLVTKKKDGYSIRILLDGRLLNEQTIRLATNLVNQLEILAHLVGKKWVTTLDLSDSFFQIPLSKKSQPYTCFFSDAHGKRYCFNRCPQGLKNSPLHLKLLMDKLFGCMADTVIHYADDIMIATDGSWEDHVLKVGQVLQRLQDGNIKVRPSKISLARENVDFLGSVWSRGKISIPAAKLKAFQEMASPETPKQAKSMICMLSYYRRHVKEFSELAQPITELAGVHPKQFKWTADHEHRLRTIIKRMCENCSLHLPDPAKPYYVQSDASNFCGSGRVFQKDEEGNEKLLAAVSRTFTKTERVYSVVKKEVLALLYTLRTMDFFLRFATKIVILVDAKAICFLRLCKDSAGILLRFSLELSKYEAEIQHVPGVDNVVADVLSRQHKDIKTLIKDEKRNPPMTEKQAAALLERLKIPTGTKFTREEVAWMLEADSLPNPVLKTGRASKAKLGARELKNTPKILPKRKVKLPAKSLRRPGVVLPTCTCRMAKQRFACNHVEAMSYNDFRTVSKAVLTGTFTPAEFKRAQYEDSYCRRILDHPARKRRFCLVDGLLYYKYETGRIKLVLPTALIDVIIQAKHFSLFGLHFSRTRIQRDVNARYHVQQQVLANKLKMMRDNCLVCQFNVTRQDNHELRTSDYIYAPRVTWGVDLMPNLPPTADGNKAALLAVDLFTGYIQICPLKDKKTKTLIEALEKTIFQPFGIPKLLRSDEETGFFRSEEFYKYLKPLGVKYLPTSVGAPWANSTAERSIRTIKEAARTFLLQEKVDDSWDKFAHFFTLAHNQSTSIYGFAPEELMFGYTKPNANDLLQFWPGARSHSEYVEKIFPFAESNRKLSRERQVKKSQQNRSYKNALRTSKQFKLGQIVSCKQLQVSTGPASKMQPQQTGPYVINVLLPDGCSALVEHLYTGDIKKEHFSNLQILSFHPRSGNRVDQNFDERLMDMLAGKQTLKSVTRRLLDLDADPGNLPPIIRQPVTSDEPHFPEDLLAVEIPDPRGTQSQDFGTLRDTDSDDDRHQRQRRQESEQSSSSSWNPDPSIFRRPENPWTDTEDSDEEREREQGHVQQPPSSRQSSQPSFGDNQGPGLFEEETEEEQQLRYAIFEPSPDRVRQVEDDGDTESVNDVEEVQQSPTISEPEDADFNDMEEVSESPPLTQLDDVESVNDVEEVQESQDSQSNSDDDTVIVSTDFTVEPDINDEDAIVVPVVFETTDDSGITSQMTEHGRSGDD